MLASATAKFCSQQEWSEPYQLNPENQISKPDNLQSAYIVQKILISSSKVLKKEVSTCFAFRSS